MTCPRLRFSDTADCLWRTGRRWQAKEAQAKLLEQGAEGNEVKWSGCVIYRRESGARTLWNCTFTFTCSINPAASAYDTRTDFLPRSQMFAAIPRVGAIHSE